MNLQRVRRMLTILSVLQNPHGRNAASLAAMCGVTKRTMFRDLKLLKQAGLALVFDERNDRYSLAGHTSLPPQPFEPMEALALIVLCHENARTHSIPLLEQAASAAMKLEAMLPAKIKNFVQPRSRAIAFGPRPIGQQPRETALFATLVDAVAERKSVRIEYESIADGGLLRCKLNPYKIVHCRHAWYVVGRSSFHRAVRTFHLARIASLRRLEDGFETPRGFSIEKYFGAAWSMIKQPGPDIEIQIRFSPRVARNVADVIWHASQQCQWEANGSLHYQVKVAGIHEIFWWILGYGDEAEVLQPESLRTLIRDKARNIARLYENAPSLHPVPG